eukprot:1425771-Alexandrium_andersonii.AAC.1
MGHKVNTKRALREAERVKTQIFAELRQHEGHTKEELPEKRLYQALKMDPEALAKEVMGSQMSVDDSSKGSKEAMD